MSSQDAAFPPRFEDLPALRELSLRQLNLLEAAPPVTGLSALRRITLQVSQVQQLSVRVDTGILGMRRDVACLDPESLCAAIELMHTCARYNIEAACHRAISSRLPCISRWLVFAGLHGAVLRGCGARITAASGHGTL